MAEITMPQKNGRRTVQAPRIDLTPMVDLGFLLITFFMYTTTMAKLRTMEITMPSNEATQQPMAYVAESTITLILTANHRVTYYEGTLEDARQLHTVAIDKIREVLLDKKKAVAALPAHYSADAHKLHVIIKPDNSSKYEDMVKTLDEMNIVAVPYYVLADVTPQETEWQEKKLLN